MREQVRRSRVHDARQHIALSADNVDGTDWVNLRHRHRRKRSRLRRRRAFSKDCDSEVRAYRHMAVSIRAHVVSFDLAAGQELLHLSDEFEIVSECT